MFCNASAPKRRLPETYTRKKNPTFFLGGRQAWSKPGLFFNHPRQKWPARLAREKQKSRRDERFYFKSQEKVGHFFFFLLGGWSRHANERGFLCVSREKKAETKFQSPRSARTGLKMKAGYFFLSCKLNMGFTYFGGANETEAHCLINNGYPLTHCADFIVQLHSELIQISGKQLGKTGPAVCWHNTESKGWLPET